MSQPLYRRVVPETYVQLLYEYLEVLGHEPESVLGQPWPTPAQEGVGGVDVECWDRLLVTAAQALDDPLLGLHVGQTISARHIGVLGSVLLACGNLGTALQRLERYIRLVYDVIPMTRRDGDGWFELVWDVSQYQPGPLVNETGMVAIMQFCRALVRGTVNPLRIDFNHPSPLDTSPYEAFFGCPVRFGQAEAVLRFSAQLLELPFKSPDPALVSLLEQHADRLLAQLPQQDEFVEQLRKTITHALREGEPSIERISPQLGTSSRTLQRRLKEAGTSFRYELNLVRHELALSYLRDPRLQIVDIAMLLGYSEHSAFTRAFKEWSGRSPHEARQLNSESY
ncbi:MULTISPECIES: AraC family transcriptional regulator [unclassified Pseudomonas]|uniref:AraC family transcriptional regulator n=1 Tax=unclassified Pseudomonas TaxID=196821 RepID=UPI00087737D9|nr:MULTISPECIES: AraC family transcriptional regulator [unclassified Pseudomonas]SCZ38750.1 AraC-type DNA-binding protein [Pseudomonas sp. NFACC44-2]SDA77700.1 AraC-type DNA-binding protein [Pseudomonas sp. NFACC51]SEJ78198.1 AraC-type DNA-binding protein [Pseudomonas sp. NFACC07-1]SFI07284.1 AraC-type DNA-binding protein [Pseudomonas sp. NFACC54]SFL54459.1 AraC-type DNA-binding protein [Pseudomonas sp. NFACC46-3]